MRGILTGRRGLAPVLLVLVVVWALVAVLLLTGTIVAARHIDQDVAIIRPEVNDIGTDTRSIKLAQRTVRISGRISEAAQPLTGRLSSTLREARGINGTAKSILLRVFSINNTAAAINGNVREINTTVHSIDSNVRGINANAQAINANAQAINASVRDINTDAKSINASVKSIRGRAGTILASGKRIDRDVAGINRRAEIARGPVSLIAGDLDAVLKGVLSIDRHANSIDCSNLINKFPSPGSSSACTTP